MKTKHTPGPWIAHGYGPTDQYIRIVKDDWPDEPICTLGAHQPPAERQANARLIAAAPELVAALEGYRQAFIESIGDPSVTPEMLKADTVAVAAIKKAEDVK